MDRWVACVWGVDCDTHREALAEIQRLREERDSAEARLADILEFVTEKAA